MPGWIVGWIGLLTAADDHRGVLAMLACLRSSRAAISGRERGRPGPCPPQLEETGGEQHA